MPNRTSRRPRAALGTRLSSLTLAVMLMAASLSVSAHHGSAEYDVTREITVRGRVVEFRWTNPHVRVVVETPDASGKAEIWDCEGPPLTWAAQRGWTASTLRQGDAVTLVMYPPKQKVRSGLVKRIERSGGDVLLVSRPWLERG